MLQHQPESKKIFPSSEPTNSSLLNRVSSLDGTSGKVTDLVCFSHLRWNFVYQRPQHLLSRSSKQWRTWFWEEPIWGDRNWLEIRQIDNQLNVVVPHIQHGTSEEKVVAQQRDWVNELLAQNQITDYVAWYYTPMSLAFTEHLQARLTVYDCMDELSAFRGAPPQLRNRERQLMQRADLIFTGGYSLFEAKRALHPAVYAFPSSIDYQHFAQARLGINDPQDQQSLATPRVGFAGVIDERFDVELLRTIAARRPEWQFILVGPVVKIDPATLPKGDNLHYVGLKSYNDLPAYFSNWQAAMLPFALNESTRFISPTKTPEYLSAGLPVVSTPIQDVVTSYGRYDPVWIADSVDAFEQAIADALVSHDSLDWAAIDAFLISHSWERTWSAMHELIEGRLQLSSARSGSLE
ncbi:glycosyltransferase [Spirosoma validum]|uniref:Glycosyltransferase n=1 Tax=Spirosoma validum TaxID=2771355 RepID=A0A927GGP5_9BACT|nr:glycosyltransferase [Spirosoma validum]MBD2757207.1 glycosyltransferase [Spirosoma validum]